jgi:hypothetical protein
MPGGSTIQRGNEVFDQMIYLPTVTVPNLPLNSTVAQAITVPGVVMGDLISWNQQSVVAGISVENIYVSAINTLTFLWSNTTTGAINGTPAQPFVLSVCRGENVSLGGLASLPNGIY